MSARTGAAAPRSPGGRPPVRPLPRDVSRPPQKLIPSRLVGQYQHRILGTCPASGPGPGVHAKEVEHAFRHLE
jgi:hypothetical protein